MKVACCQLDIIWENKPANFDKARKLLANAALPPGSLAVLPEMFSTGFTMNVAAAAETEAKETERFLASTAKELGIHLIGGLVTRAPDGRGRNQAAAFSPEGVELCRYTKLQPFTLGGEAKNYEAGQGSVTFRWGEVLVAPFICYDLRFPEVFRPVARRRPHLIVEMACWPDPRIHHWVRLLQARAIENQAYVAGCNRCGRDPQHVYSGGRTMIVDPHGEILADAGGKETVISADLDLDWLAKYRRDLPFLADIRNDYVTREK